MILVKRTNSDNTDFQAFVKELDLELKERDGDEHLFYAALNKTGFLPYTIVAYDGEKPVGSGALRKYEGQVMEIKRMYVPPPHRGRGIASAVLTELEAWGKELGFTTCILETGKNQPEAIHLYKKNGYREIPLYGAYTTAGYSVCFEKTLIS